MTADKLANALLLAALQANVLKQRRVVSIHGRVGRDVQLGGDDSLEYLAVTPGGNLHDCAHRKIGNVVTDICNPGSMFGSGGGR